MNYLDVFTFIALIYAAWKGFRKGFVIEIVTFCALFLGLYGGIHFSHLASEKIAALFEIDDQYLPTISFTVVFILVGAGVFFIGKMIETMLKVVQLGTINRVAGMLFSVLKYAFLIGTAVILIETYDEKELFLTKEQKTSSITYQPLKSFVQSMIPALEESAGKLKTILKEGEHFVEKK